MSDGLSSLADEHHEHDHEHPAFEDGPVGELVTLRDWLRYALSRFVRAGIFCGHGLVEPFDEAVYLLTDALSIPSERLELFLDACITSEERPPLLALVERRADERVPAAYLTGEAWLGEFSFRVDPRVIIPRSYFARLLEQRMRPWITDPDGLTSALDLCTGCGCLAVLMAHAFPHARITAADLSPDALDVAAENVADYGLDGSIELVESDLFAALQGQRFDLIVCNPPYVTRDSMETLPPEYLHEPAIALEAGEDGLDVVRRLLADAAAHLNPGGILAVEVGHNRDLVEAAFPKLSLTWIGSDEGEDKIFLLGREQLIDAA
ncbi:MAG: 50S ribosomal protein L3 N(5)-glutamine methyltransferase [Rhodocyclaceae bacterium]|nr:50S ribosomal protein L3 N(5)-glutamine methyltransferase [Rhodocyclaceae bacterium]